MTVVLVGEGEGEGEVGEMIDAGVRVHARVDIYGPCSGSACCGLGGPEQNLRGQQDLHSGCKMGVIANGSNMSFIPNSVIYGSLVRFVSVRKCRHPKQECRALKT